jgi:hypothetical protein
MVRATLVTLDDASLAGWSSNALQGGLITTLVGIATLELVLHNAWAASPGAHWRDRFFCSGPANHTTGRLDQGPITVGIQVAKAKNIFGPRLTRVVPFQQPMVDRSGRFGAVL